MRQAARAVIIHQNKLLVIKRNKFGKEYYILPGGGVQAGETPEQALMRELAEETGVNISTGRPVFVEEAGAPYGTQYIYLCEYAGGEPRLSPDSEEAKIHALGQNLYIPEWLPLEKLEQATFVSPELKLAIIRAIRSNFPAQPERIG
jgi:8-oxo-dGTP diphosphatase